MILQEPNISQGANSFSSCGSPAGWVLDSAMVKLRDDLRIHIFAVFHAESHHCLAIATRPVLNAPSALAVLFMLHRSQTHPMRLHCCRSMDAYLMQELLRHSERLKTPLDCIDAPFDIRSLFAELQNNLVRACRHFPRHNALQGVSRAAERWRYAYNARLLLYSARENGYRLGARSAVRPPSGVITAFPSDGIIQIEFPKPGQLRFRKVVTRSRSRSTRKFWSEKVGRHIEAESPGEENVFSELECDPSIKTFREQPCRVVYALDRHVQWHIPDALVTPLQGLGELTEFKLSQQTDDPDFVKRTALLTSCLPAYGYTYRVRNAEKSAQEPQRSNRETVLSFCGRPVNLHERELMVRECTTTSSLSWGNACSGKYGMFGRYILCRLFFEGVLSFNIDEPLDSSTRFFLRNGGL